ncbi:acyl-CoA dehydrogenase family protein [Paraburkholderia sp. MPAMCS5]|uniref:acyl-CoA dehydrogenase family protein n=1 Tax=Paraburkholderia sp. MPAMCS5 TaxID=3112563 RepID=UPI002E178C28|nr:acyl-CoA dehydrogenase family protein [Paraburkholderia sp. MPAMCS5]
MENIYIVGVGMTPFGRHIDKTIKQLTALAVEDALKDSGCDRKWVQAAFYGNCTQGHFDGQHMIRGQVALLPIGFDSIPIFNIEGACASSMRAKKEADGYVLYGKKSLVLGAVGADAFIVSARVEGEADIALLLVEAEREGLAREALPLHDGTWIEDLTFDAVRVPAENRLEGGLAALRTGLAHGIVALCADLVGAMEKTLALTAEYLKTRKQFGVPIGTFQALQHRMADMAAEMEIARSMLHAALAAMENDDEAARQHTLSAAKSLVCRAAKYVCGQGVQLHGGIGMTEEYAVGHYFKHAIVADLLLGSIDRHEAACAAALQAQIARA